MPTYEYECTRCGTVFDLFQPITEPPRKRLKKTDPRPCDCDAPVSRRISAGGGVIFKGSGFYQTDYRSESYQKAVKAESEGGKSDGKADAKTADKSAAASGARSADGGGKSASDAGGRPASDAGGKPASDASGKSDGGAKSENAPPPRKGKGGKTRRPDGNS